MQSKTFTIVTTTIRTPALLRTYAEDAIRYRRHIDEFIVVGDKKTPPEVRAFCVQLEKDFRIPCRYISVDDQRVFLERFPELGELIPWNCIQRRNVGMLAAHEGKSDIVVTVDDDNLLSQPDYLGGHNHLGDVREVEAISAQSGWWNVCEMLGRCEGAAFLSRGHPLSQRWLPDEKHVASLRITARVVVNAGLWIEEPDIDALTRLCLPIRVVGRKNGFPESVACNVGTWAPFNSQNTAILREVIPAYFLFPHIGRYDDIWASYAVRHLSDHFGDLVTYGCPVVRQERNPHNNLIDFDAERLGLEYTDVFLEALRACPVRAKTYQEAFNEVAQEFPIQILRCCESRKLDVEKFAKVITGFTVWANIFRMRRQE